MQIIINIVNNISSTSIPVEVTNNLKDVKFKPILISLYDSPKEVKEKKHQNNISCESFGIGLKNKFYIKNIFNLYKLLKILGPDIIHTHHSFSGFLGRIIAKIIGNIKVVTTIHTDVRFISWYQKFLRLASLNFADQIVFNSKNTSRSFSKWDKYLSKNIKRKIIYNGVNINNILDQKDVNFINSNYKIDEEFIIGTVGRLEKVKDHKTLIKAFSIFIKEYPNSKLIIVGSGSQMKSLKNLSEELNINNKVIFTGLLAREDVYKVINELDLFIISSKYEGFCNAMVEAMVAENAIIASNIEPLPEVLGENNGMFFEQGNSEDLAKKMTYMYKNIKLRKRFAKNAKDYAIKNYSLEKCIEEYKIVYEELLNE